MSETLRRDLPDGYSLRHPFIGRVSCYEPVHRPVHCRNLSINWCADDKLPEVLEAGIGRSIDEYVTAPAQVDGGSSSPEIHRRNFVCDCGLW